VKEGISGSALWGYNIGINKNLKKENRNNIKQILSYLCSKDTHRKITIEKKLLTPISSLYEEEEVCKNVDCKLFKSIQPILRPTSEDNNNYYFNFLNYFYEYLFQKRTLNDTIKGILDLTKIYYISIGTKENNAGLIITLLISFILMFISVSFFYLLNKNFLENFIFIPIDFWILSMLGSILILLVCFLDMGKYTVLKCHLKVFIFSVAFSLETIPLLYKLIENFPIKITFFTYINKNHHYFLLFFIIFDILFNLLCIISPYTIKCKIITDGQNFHVCFMSERFGKILILILFAYKLLIIINCLLLMIIEWKINDMQYEVNNLFIILFIYTLSYIFFVIINTIEIDHNIICFVLKTSINIIFALSNYIYILYIGNKMTINNINLMNKKINIKKYIVDTSEASIPSTSYVVKENTFSDIYSVNFQVK